MKHRSSHSFLDLDMKSNCMPALCIIPLYWCALGLLSQPANVHVANMSTSKQRDQHHKTLALFFLYFSLAVSALRESKRRHKALIVRSVCLDLTLVCVCVCVFERSSVWQTTSKNDRVAQLLWPLTLACSKTEGGWLRKSRHSETCLHTHTQSQMHEEKKRYVAQRLNLLQLEKQLWTETGQFVLSTFRGTWE